MAKNIQQQCRDEINKVFERISKLDKLMKRESSPSKIDAYRATIGGMRYMLQKANDAWLAGMGEDQSGALDHEARLKLLKEINLGE